MATSTLVNSLLGIDTDYKEYEIQFSTRLYPSDVVYIGMDYSTQTIIAEFDNESVVIGTFPMILGGEVTDYYKLIITLEVGGVNNTVIPYTYYFDFSSDGSLTNSNRNGFLQVLPRPNLNAELNKLSPILDNEDLLLTYDSDAVYVDLEVWTWEGLYDQRLGMISNDAILYSNLPVGDYTFYITAFNEPLISSTEVSLDITVEPAAISANISSTINNSIISVDSIWISDILPTVNAANILIINNNTVQLLYTTQNSTKVDIITGFYQDYYDLSPNGDVTFTNLEGGFTYIVTVIASDDEGNSATQTITFLLDEGLVVERGQIGKEVNMTFSISAGVYTKETDLSFIAEQFVGTHGSFAGKFAWGPCLDRVRVSSEENLVNIFGKPTTGNIDNVIDFFTANSFLNYSKSIDIVRLANYNGSAFINKNSVVKPYFNTLGVSATAEQDIVILNDEQYTNMLDGDLESNSFIGRFPGDFGNAIGVSWAVKSDTSTYVKKTNGFNFDLNSIVGLKNKFHFSRDKKVYFSRGTTIENTARSYVDIGDWINANDVRYQVKNITLGSDTSQAVTSVTVSASKLYATAPTLSFAAPSSGTTATGTAVLSATGGVRAVTVSSGGSYTTAPTVTFSAPPSGTTATGTITTSGSGHFVVVSIAITDAGTGYTTPPTITITPSGAGTTTTPAVVTSAIGFPIQTVTVNNGGSGYTAAPAITVTGTGYGSGTTTLAAVTALNPVDIIEIDRVYTGTVSTGLYSNGSTVTGFDVYRQWRFSNIIPVEPDATGIHLIIFDATGKITGVQGSILEQYKNMSFSASAKNEDGTSNYLYDRVNTSSYYIRIGTKDLVELSQEYISTEPLADGKNWVTNYVGLSGGTDAFASMGLDDDIQAYDLFKDPEQCDAPVIIGNFRSIKNNGGLTDSVLATYLIQNIAENRKDSMVFTSCRRESVVNNPRNEVREILKDVLTLPSSSYGEMDSGWKYIYDRYNDRYIWIPTVGDHAGCYARTDVTNDAWFSAAGEQRGILKNVVKLAFNPNESQRDQLYANRVNPIVTFPSKGTMIFGDKTLLSQASSFNRIPTRRLFIVLEKTLANASRFALFEFNDEITRSQVRGIIEPYLAQVKSGRGVADYKVIVDESINTPQVIGNNQFLGRILIKPNYSINFIELNFVNIGAGNISFEEANSLI